VARENVTGAVDIGGTKIAVGAVDAQGRLLAKQEIATADHAGFISAMEGVVSTLAAIGQELKVEFCGIGIGCTGPVDPIRGVVGDVAFLPGWKGCNPVEYLACAFDVDVAMENDADAAVLAEARWGVGRDKSSIICVTIGTGIGAGIVLDGKLYRGARATHPELGHHVIDSTGPRCFCGANGCWEVLARGPAMAERMRSSQADGESIEARMICDMARRGEPNALAEVSREGGYLGIGVANLVTLFAPDAIVLGGSVMKAADLLMPIIQETVSQSCGLVDWQATRITRTSLGNDTPLIGAGMVWRHRFEGAHVE
jgi:glucokinase